MVTGDLSTPTSKVSVGEVDRRQRGNVSVFGSNSMTN